MTLTQPKEKNMPGPTPTWDADLLAAQHQALDQAVLDQRITPAQKAIAADVLDGRIDDAEAQRRYEALAEEALG